MKTLQRPVVLMYHGIVSEWTVVPTEREPGAELYDLSTDRFQDQLAWLKDNSYAVSLLPCSTTDIVLTFDDGEKNNYDYAFPILRKFGYPAYFFVIAKRIGQPGYMGWDELNEMRRDGMAIGSHGFSHEILTGLLDTQIEEELRASKKYIERNMNMTVDAFSVPRGFCNDKIVRMAYEAGYKYVFISERPGSMTAECYTRLAVKAHWNLKRFGQMVEGEIPWFERMAGQCKDLIKKIFGGAVYDVIRRVLLKI